jgi:hypothetical protein
VAAAPLDCPEMDGPMLMRMAQFAIQCNFHVRKTRKNGSTYDVHRHLHELPHGHFTLLPDLRGNHCLGLEVRGPAGGQWKLLLNNGRLTAVEAGISRQCSAVFQLEARTFHELGTREFTAMEAVEDGRVVIQGNGMPQSQLAAILQATAGQERRVVERV